MHMHPHPHIHHTRPHITHPLALVVVISHHPRTLYPHVHAHAHIRVFVTHIGFPVHYTAIYPSH